MASTEDEEAFAEIIEREFDNQVPPGAEMGALPRTMLTGCSTSVNNLVRLPLAIYGLVVTTTAPVTLLVAGVYAAYWGWYGSKIARPLIKTGWHKLKHPDPEQIEAYYASMDKIDDPVSLAAWLRRLCSLVPALVMSIFAALGVSHLTNPPLGIVAGIIFFGITFLNTVTVKGTAKERFRYMKFMRPGPKNTLET